MIRAPYIISFILAVCCSFRHNAAIPLASHSAVTNQMQDIFKKEKTDSQSNWKDTTLQSYSPKEIKLSDVDRTSATKTHNLNYHGPQKKKTVNNNQSHTVIRNINMNINDFYHGSYRQGKKKDSLLTTINNLEDVITKEQHVNCANDKKKNQRYSSSFVGNSTNHNLSVEKEFNEVVGNNSKAKTTSSVHEGEDITLCWIETMTIKENKTVEPPKRLVIREYTISFENSATIPDRYLECKRLEGELGANDLEIGKTALFEVIDEDTKVSKVVNFTSIGHIGDVTIWQHKRVKCGVGPVVSKNIIEWNDGSDNPKKRVEIRVSPKMHKLTTKNEEEPCTQSTETTEIEESSIPTDGTSYVTEPCKNTKNGICEVTTKSSEESTKYLEISTTEKAITELPRSSSEEESEEDLSLSVGVTTSSPDEKEISTESSVATETPVTIFVTSDESLSSKKDGLDCENSSDPACAVRDVTTSSWELPTESSATTETNTQTGTSSTASVGTATTSIPASQEATTKVGTEKELSSQKRPLLPTEPFISIEVDTSEEMSDLVTVRTSSITPTTVSEYESVSMESAESTRQPTVETTTTIIESLSQGHGVTTTTTTTTTTIPETDVTTSPSVVKGKEEHMTDKEISGSVSEESTEEDIMMPSTESTSKRSDRVDYVPPLESNTVTSGEIGTEQAATTATPLIIEFTQAPGKSGKILGKLLATVSTESTTIESASGGTTIESIENTASESLSTETTAIEFSSTSEEGSVRESKENLTHEIEEATTTRPKVAVEEEFISTVSTTTTVSEMPEIESTTLPPTTSNEYDYICEDSEDCAYISSSEACDESGNCGSTSESCELGVCSKEQGVEDKSISDVTSPSTMKTHTPMIDLQSSEVPTSEVQQQLTSTTAATLISEEGDNSSMTIGSVPTVETRRSTPLSSTTTPRHKLILKIKVLLEHVNEKMEKENLVEVDKQLSLDENPEHHGHPDMFKRLKSFNDSINMEAISALLNCTSLGNLTRGVSLVSKQPSQNVDSKSDELQFTFSANTNSRQSFTSEQAKDDLLESDQKYETESRKRKRRDFASNKEDTILNTFADLVNPASTLNANSMKESIRSRNEQKTSNAAHGKERNEIKSTPDKRDIEKTKMEIVRQALPDVVKDFSVGFQNVMSQFARHNSMENDPKKVPKVNLFDIITNPKDSRFHSRRRRAATEEVGRWSNERIRKAAIGGNLRSFTEFVLYDILS
ncbi:hypothetical protein DMN91_010274 [Ooceraea biroi]|uniref:Uncharacterized protein n=2 Tax=Ooceraea biroi TaxID=2015173 RepID=A0A3L8DD04_OOCBI|nr:hypothetical protein DMN91_010274 [Ooceraea biroi]